MFSFNSLKLIAGNCVLKGLDYGSIGFYGTSIVTFGA